MPWLQVSVEHVVVTIVDAVCPLEIWQLVLSVQTFFYELLSQFNLQMYNNKIYWLYVNQSPEKMQFVVVILVYNNIIVDEIVIL